MLVSSDGRLAGSVSGGCVEGAAYEEVERARADGRQRVIRYGISDEQAWDVGLACGGTIDVLVQPSLPAEVELAARELGRAVITPLPADAPGPAFGPVAPGAGSAPEPALTLDAGRDSLVGTTGDAADGSSPGDARRRRPAARHVADGRGRGTAVLRRGVRRHGRGWSSSGAVQVAIPLVALARTLGYETVVVDGRPAFASASASRMPTGSSSAGRTRSPTRSDSDRTTRSPSCPRRQVRRAGDRHGAVARLPLRGRRRQPQDAGRPPRAAASGRRQ